MATIVNSMDAILQAATPRLATSTLPPNITVPSSSVTGLGTLASQNLVNLTNQVTGALAAGNITGLGALALLNTVDLSTQTTGTINGATQVTNLGNLAYANTVAANQIAAGTLAVGVQYAGIINVNQLNAGTMSSTDAAHSITIGTSTFVDGLGGTWSVGSKFKRTGNSVGPSIVVDDVSSSPATYAMSVYSSKGGAAKFQGAIQSVGTNIVWIDGQAGAGDGLKVTGTYTNNGVNSDGYFINTAAVRGFNTNGSGTGLYGYGGSYGIFASGGSYAGYFSGQVMVTGNLTVNGTINGTVSNATTSTRVLSSGNASLLASFGTHEAVIQTDGNFVVYKNGAAFWSSNSTGGNISDRKFKENINLTTKRGLSTLNALRVVDFTWKPDSPFADSGIVHTGFIAQEVQNIIEDAVTEVDGTTLLSKETMIPYLVKGMQELSVELLDIKRELAALKQAN